MEELPYPIAEIRCDFGLSKEDEEVRKSRRVDWMRDYLDTINDARIMLMRTSIGPDVPPAKKNLAVFLKYN